MSFKRRPSKISPHARSHTDKLFEQFLIDEIRCVTTTIRHLQSRQKKLEARLQKVRGPAAPEYQDHGQYDGGPF